MLRTFEADYPILGHQLNAVVSVDAGHNLRHLIAEHRCQRGHTVKYRGDLEAQLAKRGRHLGPDETHPHDQRSGPRKGSPADRIAFLARPKLIHARHLAPGHLKSAVTAARAK